MQESIINEISNNVKSVLDKEENKNIKINNLEKQLNKMQNYITRPGTYSDIHEIEETKSFENFIRKGDLSDLVTKSMQGNAEEGGVLITPSLNRKIITSMNAKSIMRSLSSVEKISSKTLDILFEDENFSSGWVSETDNRPVTGNSKIRKKSISVHDIYAQPKASQSLIDDAEINIENWLSERISNSFTKLENEAFFTGDGQGKPKGLLLNEDISKINMGSNISTDNLLELINSLDEEFLGSASFLMNRKTLSVIQNLKDNNGRFIWNQSLSDPLQQTIFGIPVSISSSMPDINTDSLSIALGDFKAGYKIVDRSNINIMRDPYTEKPFVKFYAVKRVGGDVINPSAIKFAHFTEEAQE